jgi:methylenetetrahydrofolate reductase (NADPH)
LLVAVEHSNLVICRDDFAIMTIISEIKPLDNKANTKALLAKASIEVTGKQIDKLPVLQQHLLPGTKVFIALIDASETELQIAMASALRQAGFEPIPHIPARFVKNAADLDERLKRLTGEANVTNVLALGGGAPQPLGDFHCAMQLMQTDLFQKHAIKSVGIAGHPEGNPDITKIHGEAMLIKALQEKNAWLQANHMEGYIATQFVFDAMPVAHWATELQANGITLPIHVGVPGPATIKTLVRYAALCGVGNSARFIRKQALNITKLLSVSEPNEMVSQLAFLHFERPELNIGGAHLYPFGGFDKLFAWTATKA